MAKYRIIYTETHEAVVDLGDIFPHFIKQALEDDDGETNIWELCQTTPETTSREAVLEAIKTTRKAAGSGG